MLADVLAATSAAESIERVIVVTGERRAERLALRHAQRSTTPLEVLQEPIDRGHSEAATLGIVRALALGAECSALLPGDCPLLDAAELDGALARMDAGRVAVIPDRHGTGTNGLLLAPADAIGPAFGPGSADRHRERAERAGFAVATGGRWSRWRSTSTRPTDLEALATELAERPERAPRTAEALA